MEKEIWSYDNFLGEEDELTEDDEDEEEWEEWDDEDEDDDFGEGWE